MSPRRDLWALGCKQEQPWRCIVGGRRIRLGQGRKERRRGMDVQNKMSKDTKKNQRWISFSWRRDTLPPCCLLSVCLSLSSITSICIVCNGFTALEAPSLRFAYTLSSSQAGAAAICHLVSFFARGQLPQFHKNNRCMDVVEVVPGKDGASREPDECRRERGGGEGKGMITSVRLPGCLPGQHKQGGTKRTNKRKRALNSAKTII